MNRQVNSPLQNFFADPTSFELVQAVRLLHQEYGKDLALVDFLQQRVRIRPHLSLAFSARDIVDFEVLEQDGRPPMFRITASMLSLYGAASPLPTFYTEDLLAEKREDRSAARDFLDILNSSYYAFYLWAGWFRYHPARSLLEQHDQSMSERLMALAGLDASILTTDKALRLRPLAGLLTQFPHSAVNLEALLSSMLHVPVTVEQCVMRKAPVPKDQQCCLGREHRLGESVIIGSFVEDIQGKIAIHVGPISPEVFLEFTPGGSYYQDIQELVFYFCTEPLCHDLHLRVQTENLPPLVLCHADDSRCAILGGNAWLGSGVIEETHDAMTGHVCFPDAHSWKKAGQAYHDHPYLRRTA